MSRNHPDLTPKCDASKHMTISRDLVTLRQNLGTDHPRYHGYHTVATWLPHAHHTNTIPQTHAVSKDRAWWAKRKAAGNVHGGNHTGTGCFRHENGEGNARTIDTPIRTVVSRIV